VLRSPASVEAVGGRALTEHRKPRSCRHLQPESTSPVSAPARVARSAGGACRPVLRLSLARLPLQICGCQSGMIRVLDEVVGRASSFVGSGASRVPIFLSPNRTSGPPSLCPPACPRWPGNHEIPGGDERSIATKLRSRACRAARDAWATSRCSILSGSAVDSAGRCSWPGAPWRHGPAMARHRRR
jgi:hypothetical protein